MSLLNFTEEYIVASLLLLVACAVAFFMLKRLRVHAVIVVVVVVAFPFIASWIANNSLTDKDAESMLLLGNIQLKERPKVVEKLRCNYTEWHTELLHPLRSRWMFTLSVSDADMKEVLQQMHPQPYVFDTVFRQAIRLFERDTNAVYVTDVYNSDRLARTVVKRSPYGHDVYHFYMNAREKEIRCSFYPDIQLIKAL